MRTQKTWIQVALVAAAVVAAAQATGAGTAQEEPYTIDKDIEGWTNAYGYCVEPVDLEEACGGGRVPYTPTMNTRGTLNNLDEDTRTPLVEMAWEPDGVLGTHLGLDVHCEEAESSEHPCHQRVHGESPLVVRVDKEDADWDGYSMDQKWPWFVRHGYGMLGTGALVGADVGLAWEQDYTIYVTVFQHEPAPEGYSRLP